MILAIDPGKDKIGVALYDPEAQTVVDHEIVAAEQFSLWFLQCQKEHDLQTVVIGDGTHSKTIQTLLKELAPATHQCLVNEAYSTLEAREVYFQLYPPRGLKRWIPYSLQTPERPIDDLVAIILLQRYLGQIPKIGR